MAEMLNGDSCTSDEFPYDMYRLNPPTISEIAEVLHNGMEPLFHLSNVDVASCPCLTREPYNLVGVGLCGNTTMVEFASTTEDIAWNHRIYDIKSVLSASCHDSFIIGSSYATKPHMPYFGHLIMNAKYSAPDNFTNASRIVFAERGNRQNRIETLTDSNQMTCTNVGNFFLSEGRAGNVIRMRARGRKMIDTDIITSMQAILYENFMKNKGELFALGGVLRMRYGQVACNVMWDEYPNGMLQFGNFYFEQRCIEMTLESDLIAVGVIVNNAPYPFSAQRYGINLYNKCEFHCFSNYGSGGQFISDTTPDTTEYEGYFNVVENLIHVPNVNELQM